MAAPRSWRAIVAAIAILTVLWGPAPGTREAGAQDPGKLRIPFPRYDGTLTPTTFELGYPLMTLVYDTLLWRDRSGRPEPWLARSLRRGAGGRRLVVTLRDDARWHDGRRVTAADVAFTFRFFRERPHPRFTPQLLDVLEVAPIGPSTVRFTLSDASPGFPGGALSDVPILPRHLWSRLPPGRAAPSGPAVGSGPYRLTQARRGAPYRFRANRRYFRGSPRVSRIEVPVIRDFARTLRLLQNGGADMLPVSLSGGAAERVRGPTVEVARGSLYSGTALMFNTRRPPFDAPAARVAVSRALDLRRLALALEPESAMAADRGYLAPGTPWATRAPLHRHLPAAARRGLRPLAKGTLRVLASRNDPLRLEAGRQVVLALERAGARATLVPLSRERLGSAVGENREGEDFQAAVWEIPALASYEPGYMRVIFGSDPRRGVLNYSGYRSTTFDGLARRAARELSPDRRAEAIRDQLELLARDAPVVPLFYPKGAFAFRPAVYDGWEYVRGSGILDKRSFLARAGRPRTHRASSDGEPPSPGTGLGPAGWIAVVLGAVAVALALAGILGRIRG